MYSSFVDKSEGAIALGWEGAEMSCKDLVISYALLHCCLCVNEKR